MPSKIVERISAEAGVPQLFSALSETIPLSDLQSLLMEVYQSRASALRAKDLTERATRSLVAPSNIDARLLNEFDHVAFRLAEAFEAIELSPIGPLGLNHVLGSIDQNSVLTTIRNAEVLGDPTMPLALECWRRRKDSLRRSSTLRLCTSQRVVRLQPFDVPGYVPHFRLFALVSAGRDVGSYAFEMEHMTEHIRFYLRLFRALNECGFHFGAPLVEISHTDVTRVLVESKGIKPEELQHAIRAHRPGGSEKFLSELGLSFLEVVDDHRLSRLMTYLTGLLKDEFPEAQLRTNIARLEGLAYYNGFCLRISPETTDGERYPIVDGGFTDWTARLLQDRKERLLTTGIGTEFVCFRYR